MNLERLLELLADNQRERAKLVELLAWISEVQASAILNRARKSASHGMRLKRAVQNEVIGLTLRHSSELGYVLDKIITDTLGKKSGPKSIAAGTPKDFKKSELIDIRQKVIDDLEEKAGDLELERLQLEDELFEARDPDTGHPEIIDRLLKRIEKVTVKRDNALIKAGHKQEALDTTEALRKSTKRE